MFRVLYGDVEKIPNGKKAYEMKVWLEATLTLAILKYPNMELKKSIETYLNDRQDKLSLTNKEFILHVDAVLLHAAFKGKAWINKEYEKTRSIKAAKDLLKYGPSVRI